MTARSALAAFLTAALTLVLSVQARAQDDLTLATSVVPPNVMLLADTSGSMSHAVWHEDFDSGVFQDGALVLASCDIGAVPAVAGSDTFCPTSGDSQGRCPNNGDRKWAGQRIYCLNTALPAGCAAAPAGWSCTSSGSYYRFTLPDYTPGARLTRWSKNYLSWLFTEMLTNSTPSIPAIDRMETMKTVLLDLVDDINPDGFNENVRFGLATFSSGNDPDGGFIKEPIASGNKVALTTKLGNLSPSGWTPLAETLVDIGEYMSGDNNIATCSPSGSPGSSPMDDWCRKNFVLIVTDGEPTKDDFDHGPGTADFVCAIGNADGDLNESPDEYSGRTDAAPYGSQGTDWLDDVSYEFYNTDLRTDLEGLQNIVTYTVGFSLDHPLLGDTATNSTGEYFTANNATELAQDLHAAVLAIIERSTSFTAASVPASRTAFSDGLYAAYFLPRVADPTWEGHLEAYRLSSSLEVLDKNGAPALDAAGSFVEPRKPIWDLGLRLLDAAHPPRAFYTTLGGARSSFDASSINAATLGVLAAELTAYPNDPGVPFADTEALTDAIVNYMHGLDAFDDDRDGVTTEQRDWVLGDIFHSRPIAVGPPSNALSHEDGFGPATDDGTFLKLFSQRDRRLYVGANDGMLHGVEAGSFQAGNNPATPETENGYYDLGSGDEVFAYVPGVLLDTVKFIPRNGIPRSYYYVDGSASAADAWFPSFAGDTDKQGNEWTTVLVTGMRQGGPGYLALDITDPGAVAGSHGPYPKLLWEFDDPNEPAGESWSRPILTRVKVAGPGGSGDHCGPDDGDGDCREQWVAIIGGGFLADGDPNLGGYVADPNDPAWTDDSKAVFVIALDTGVVLAKLSRDPADSQLKKMVYAMPSTPAVLDLELDGFADLVYIGDTGGQLWKWDLSEVGKDSNADGLVDATSWPAGVFFESAPELVSGTLHYRSLFFPPVASFIEGELTLAFGTGERTSLGFAGDATADENNRFYVVRDPQPTGLASIPATPYAEANLSDITSLATVPTSTNLGFYFVVQDGEKFVTNHLIFAGFAITTSFLPDTTGEVCSAQGQAFLHIVDLLSGAGGFDPAGGASNQGRTLAIGSGVPTGPQISTSSEGGSLFVQTSRGNISKFDAPGDDLSPVELVYWKQDR